MLGKVKWFNAEKGTGLLSGTMEKETYSYTSQQSSRKGLSPFKKAKQ